MKSIFHILQSQINQLKDLGRYSLESLRAKDMNGRSIQMSTGVISKASKRMSTTANTNTPSIIGGGLGKIQSPKEEQYFNRKQKEILNKIQKDPNYCDKSIEDCSESITEAEFFEDKEDCIGRQKTICNNKCQNIREEIHFYEEVCCFLL